MDIHIGGLIILIGMGKLRKFMGDVVDRAERGTIFVEKSGVRGKVAVPLA